MPLNTCMRAPPGMAAAWPPPRCLAPQVPYTMNTTSSETENQVYIPPRENPDAVARSKNNKNRRLPFLNGSIDAHE